MAEVAHGFLEGLLRRRVVPHALVLPGVVAQLAGQLQRRLQHLHHDASVEMAGAGPELLLGAQQQALAARTAPCSSVRSSKPSPRGLPPSGRGWVR